MKLITSLLLLSSTLLSHTILAQNSDSEVTAAWEQSGTCAYFFEKPGAWKPLAQTCIKYCETQPDGHGYSECDHSPYKDLNLPDGISQSTILRDESGDSFVPCKCICSNADVEGITDAILDVVIEALSHLDEIICGVFMTAMVTIVEVGIMAVPGGAEATAAARAVQGVKSFTENALDVADSMGNWVGKICGIEDPNWPNSLFDLLLHAPDSYGTSVGCKKKNKADCKGVDPVLDKPRSKGIDGPATKNPDPISSAPQADPTNANKPPLTSKAVSSVSTNVPPVSTNVGQPSVTNNAPSASTSIDQPAASTKLTASVDPTASTSIDPSVTTSVLVSSSSTDNCAIGTATQSGSSCGPTTPCKIANPDRGGNEAGLEDIIDLTTGLTDILRIRGTDGHRSPRSLHRLSKRDEKRGKPCSKSTNAAYKNWTLSSDKFPSNGQLGATVDSWGYKKADNLCEYDWLQGKTRIKGNLYDSEHVMEWQIVTDFFRKLQAMGGLNYDHPDPNQAGTKTDFCTYWIESWTLDPTQAFSVNNSDFLLPWRHIASAYPGTKNYKDEMVRLQRNINQHAKAGLFTDTIPYIWDESNMNKKVKSDRNKVLERMRLLLGARIYLVDPRVITIFKNQKERMGKIIDQLDTDMETHTRLTTQTSIDPVTGAVTTRTVSYTPWKKQNLLTEWNKYMDTKWADATAKHKKVMDKFIKALSDQHCRLQAMKTANDKKFCQRLDKLKIEYRKVKAFSKPW